MILVWPLGEFQFIRNHADKMPLSTKKKKKHKIVMSKSINDFRFMVVILVATQGHGHTGGKLYYSVQQRCIKIGNFSLLFLKNIYS